VASQLQRVRVPQTYPRERIVLGELHLLRRRLDGVLADLAWLAADAPLESDWLKVEEASRLARRALLAGLAAVPPFPFTEPDGLQVQSAASASTRRPAGSGTEKWRSCFRRFGIDCSP
jgi:hypothetical protein